MAATEPEWAEWSDAEIMARLLRRGVEPVTAKGWVRDREMPDAADEISAVLDREYLDERNEPIRFELDIDRRARR